MEKSLNHPSTASDQDPEASPLLTNDNPDVVFERALDSELEKICAFYQLKELEIYGEVGTLLKDGETFEAETGGLDLSHLDGPSDMRSSRSGRTRHENLFRNPGFKPMRQTSTLSASINEDGESDDDADESAALNSNSPVLRKTRTWDANAGQSVDDLRSSRELPAFKRRTSQVNENYSDQSFMALYTSGITLKKRTISLYVSLCELKSFIQLNKTGFSKALKKYDKTMNRNFRNAYIKANITPAYPFRESTLKHLDENIDNIEKSYADVFTKGDLASAKRELRLHLREHVVWERNTVWREMIGIERKAQAANMGLRRTLLGGDHDPSKSRLQGDEPDDTGTKELVTPIGRFKCPSWLFSSTFFTLVSIVAIFIVLLMVPIMKEPEQQNCLAMLVFVSLLWATEVNPIMKEPKS